jgi:hypothetical protein
MPMSNFLTSARQTDKLHVLVSDAQASLKLSTICPIGTRPGLYKVRILLYALYSTCQGIGQMNLSILRNSMLPTPPADRLYAYYHGCQG